MPCFILDLRIGFVVSFGISLVLSLGNDFGIALKACLLADNIISHNQRNKTMIPTKKVCAIVLASVLSSCRLFMPQEEIDRIDRCVYTIPVLREYPSRPYRVLGGRTAVIEAEQLLLNKACLSHADAVVIEVEHGLIRKRKPMIVGVFIRYI